MNIFNRKPVFINQYRKMSNDRLKEHCANGYLFLRRKRGVDPEPDYSMLEELVNNHKKDIGIETTTIDAVNRCFEEYYRRSVIGDI